MMPPSRDNTRVNHRQFQERAKADFRLCFLTLLRVGPSARVGAGTLANEHVEPWGRDRVDRAQGGGGDKLESLVGRGSSPGDQRI